MAKSNLKEKEENSTKVTGLYLTKIQIKDNRAIIEYKEDKDLNKNEGTFTGLDDCTEEFLKLFQDAKDIFGELIPSLRKELSEIKMNVIKFEYNNQGFLDKVLFSIVYKYSASGNVTNISTGLIPIYKEELAENVLSVSGKHEELLHQIIKAAKAYMNGETRTKQMKLVVDNS